MRDYRIEMGWLSDEECNVFWVLEGDVKIEWVKVEWFYLEKNASLFIQNMRTLAEDEDAS